MRFLRSLALLAALAPACAGTAYADADLIGGTPADPKDFPASVYAKSSGGACSATVVGERVLAIAAHCVDNGKTVSFSVGANQYSARCTHSPDYKNDDTADYTLCLIDKAVTGVEYEHLATDGSWCAKDAEVLLTGYGCIRNGGGGGNDGVYRTGKAKVTSCPSRDNDTVTKGGAALCYGDSGGPAFRVEADGARVVFGVNSRGDIRTTSYLSTWTTAKGKAFVKKWREDNGQKICGVDDDATGCRGDGAEPPPPPPPPPPPADCSDELAAHADALATGSRTFAALKACLTRAPTH